MVADMTLITHYASDRDSEIVATITQKYVETDGCGWCQVAITSHDGDILNVESFPMVGQLVRNTAEEKLRAYLNNKKW